MSMLYNPPRQANPDIEIKKEWHISVGDAAIFQFTDYVELVEFSFKRTSLSNRQTIPAQLCRLMLSFFKGSDLVKRRYFYLYFAAGVDHHYPMTIIKPQGADKLQLVSNVALFSRIDSRLIFKQEVPDAVGIPPLING